jgi:hypothetical protein
MKTLNFLLCVCLCGSLGCGQTTPTETLRGWFNAVNPQTRGNLAQIGLAIHEAAEGVGGGGRKLVYHSEIALVVEDLTASREKLEALVKHYHGIIANAEITSSPGAPRSGVWRLRVPPDDFEAFVKALASLGELIRSQQELQDVTRSYSELEEQIKNKASEIEGLRELAKKPREKLAETLAVQEQLTKATNDLVSLKGRLERMRAQAEYSTVLLQLNERSGYVPETAPAAGIGIFRAFTDSWQLLLSCGRKLAIGIAMAVPWLPVIGLAIIAARVLGRRWSRRRVLAPTAGA